MCAHVRQLMEAAANDMEEDELQTLRNLLCGLFAHQEACPNCSSWFQKLVAPVARAIGERVLVVGGDNPLEVPEASAGKKRRIDQDFRAAIMESAKDFGASTPQAFARSQGQVADSTMETWFPRWLGGMRSAQLLTFAQSRGAVSVAFDAGRFGCPKEDTLVLAVCLSGSGVGTWLPPQAGQPEVVCPFPPGI